MKKIQITDLKTLSLLFVTALSFRFSLLIISLSINGYDRLFNDIILVKGNDPLTYHQLAINLINYHSFVYQPGLPPVTLRTPGYPLFISFIYFLLGSEPLLVILFQIIFDSLTCLLIFKLTKIITNYRIAIIAAILYAFEPHASIFSLSMYSDTIFVFFITLFGYLFVKYLKDNKIHFLISSAIVLGITILIKPSSIYLPIIIIVFVILRRGKEFKVIIRDTLYFLFILLLVISPWLIRNYLHFNKFFLSTSGEYNLLVLNITPLKMELTKLPQDSAIYTLLSEADSLMKSQGVRPVFNKTPENYWDTLTLQYDFNKAEYWKKTAFDYMEKYPLIFIKYYSLGILHTFANVGTSAFSTYFNLSTKSSVINIKSESNIFLLIKRYFSEKNIFEILIGLTISIFLLMVYISCFIGIVKIKFFENRIIVYFLMVLVIYFVMISGAGGLVRFKLPAIPFYLVFASVGFDYISTRISNNRIFRKLLSVKKFFRKS